MADWRDGTAYAVLLDAERPLFAWEWLRRNPDYRCAADRALSRGTPKGDGTCSPKVFGLAAFEDPALGAPEARPMWAREQDPSVLCADVTFDAGVGDAFDPAIHEHHSSVVRSNYSDHLLLSDGLKLIRLDLPAGALSGNALNLHYRLHGLASAAPRLLTLQRLLAFCRLGTFSRSLHRREPQSRRRILQLRTFDALASGAGQREIAASLLSAAVLKPQWREQEASVRLQAQRLVRSARTMAAGGWRQLFG